MRTWLAVLMLVSCFTAVPKATQACSTVFIDKNDQVLIGHNMDGFTDRSPTSPGRLVLVTNKRHVKKQGFVFTNDPPFTWTSKYGSISLVAEDREITGRGMR